MEHCVMPTMGADGSIQMAHNWGVPTVSGSSLDTFGAMGGYSTSIAPIVPVKPKHQLSRLSRRERELVESIKNPEFKERAKELVKEGDEALAKGNFAKEMEDHREVEELLKMERFAKGIAITSECNNAYSYNSFAHHYKSYAKWAVDQGLTVEEACFWHPKGIIQGEKIKAGYVPNKHQWNKWRPGLPIYGMARKEVFESGPRKQSRATRSMHGGEASTSSCASSFTREEPTCISSIGNVYANPKATYDHSSLRAREEKPRPTSYNIRYISKEYYSFRDFPEMCHETFVVDLDDKLVCKPICIQKTKTGHSISAYYEIYTIDKETKETSFGTKIYVTVFYKLAYDKTNIAVPIDEDTIQYKNRFYHKELVRRGSLYEHVYVTKDGYCIPQEAIPVVHSVDYDFEEATLKSFIIPTEEPSKPATATCDYSRDRWSTGADGVPTLYIDLS